MIDIISVALDLTQGTDRVSFSKVLPGNPPIGPQPDEIEADEGRQISIDQFAIRNDDGLVGDNSLEPSNTLSD
jgi:hypothetical protein